MRPPQVRRACLRGARVGIDHGGSRRLVLLLVTGVRMSFEVWDAITGGLQLHGT